MPDIEAAAFTDTITNEDWATLSTTGPGQQAVEEFLEAHGWDQRAAVVVNLKLSVDNTKVTAARLSLVGKWDDKPVRIQARKLWKDLGDNVVLEVYVDSLAQFCFADGEMWSNYVVGDTLKHKFFLLGEREEPNGGGVDTSRSL